MNVLMIHGIKQEDSTSEDLLDKWEDTLLGASAKLLTGTDIQFPYYGKILAKWANGGGDKVVSMSASPTSNPVGVNGGDADELQFIHDSLIQVAKANKISKKQIEDAEAQVGENHATMDNFFYRSLNALLRLIEDVSPAKGSYALRLIKQAYIYLDSPGARAAVDAIVFPQLQRSPQVVISHSLGTVIAFKLIREMEEKNIKVDIPLLITMGSPLGLDAIQKKLGLPREKPASVRRWVNFYDRSDFVTLGKPLSAKNFGEGIVNDGKVDNRTLNCHGVVGYLPHPGVIKELKDIFAKGCA